MKMAENDDLRLGPMIRRLRTTGNVIEIRDADQMELGTFPQDSIVFEINADAVVLDWFPGGAPGTRATLTVALRDLEVGRW